MPNKRFVYLNDLTNQAPIMDLETGEVLQIHPAQIKGGGAIGLRRFILEQKSASVFVETGEQEPITEDLLDEMESSYHPPNGWNYDYPNPTFERSVSDEALQALKEKLEAMMARYPYKFEIKGIQPRFLMYFSDGNATSQQRFVALVPQPGASNPFRQDGTLKARYRGTWGSLERDAKTDQRNLPYYQRYAGLSMSPLIYTGPAAVVRFLVDDQIVAFQGCRVYVTLNGDFICSDWCQRHDHSSYSNGINLQEGIYDFASWIAGPGVGRAMSQGVFTPKSVTIKTESVRAMLKKPNAAVVVPTFEEAFGAALKLIAKEESANVDTLKLIVEKSYGAYPGLTADERIEKLTSIIGAAFEAKDGYALAGASLIVPAKKIFIPSGVDLASNKHGAEDYVFTVRVADACGVPLAEGKACIEQGVFHQHVAISTTTLDIARTRHEITKSVTAHEATHKPPEPEVEVPEITLDAITEAKAAMLKAEEDRLVKELVELLAKNKELAEMIKLDEKALDASHVFPSLIPVCVIRDNIQIVPVDEHTIILSDTTGEAVSLTATRTEKFCYKDEKGVGIVPSDPTFYVTIRWYFEEFLPKQLGRQLKAYADSPTFTVNEESFRAYPVVDGTSLIRLVDGTPSESVTVRRASNGVLYRVGKHGENMQLAENFRTAAHHYTKVVKPTLEAVA
jgi:hypothetical protein